MQLVCDAVVLEALVSLARAEQAHLPAELLPRLEDLGFDWALRQAEYVDSRYSELAPLKERVGVPGRGVQIVLGVEPRCSELAPLKSGCV